MKATLRPCKEDFKSLPIQFTVTLKHSWHRTLMDPGDIVRIVGVFSQENQFHLSLDDLPLEHPQDPEKKRTDKGRYLVLEPDILIPSTGISTAYPWPRVPLLRELFKNAEGDPNYALILGNIVHLVFQKILENIQGRPIQLIYRPLRW